jgi:exosortase E/protease (VPEID-CTERM system)
MFTLFGCTILFPGPALRAETGSWGPDPGMSRRRLLGLGAVHVAAVTAGWGLAVRLVRDGAGDPVAALAAAACGLTAAVALALAVLSVSDWTRLAARAWPALLVAGGVSLAAWGTSLVSARLWEPLGRGTLAAVHGLLALVGADPVVDADEFLVGTKAFTVCIAPQCSGYEGIGLVVAFVGGYLWVFRAGLRFPQALLLLPLGAAAAWGLNAGRIAALVLIGSAGAPEVAVGGFHSQAGWLAFNAVALGIVLLADRSGWVGRRPADAPGPPPAWTAAFLAPFLGLALTAMVTASAARDGFDWGYPARVAVGIGLLWAYRRYYPRPTWSWAAVAAGLGVAGMWVLLVPRTPADQTGLADLPTWAAVGWVVGRVVGACLVVPVAEELAFRGYLTRRLVSSRFERVSPGQFRWLPVLASSALFGLLHREWLAGCLAGVVFAALYHRRGRLGDAVLGHATANVALVAWGTAVGDWRAWG